MSNELTSLPQALASTQYPLPQIPSRAMRHPEAPVVAEQIRDGGLSSENDFLRSEKKEPSPYTYWLSSAPKSLNTPNTSFCNWQVSAELC